MVTLRTFAPALREAARVAHQNTLMRWGEMRRAERLTTGLILLMIAAGVVLRIQGIGFPPYFTFDEQFYAPTAHHYLVGTPDLHDFHPPLGKLLGSIGLLLFGYTSVGWRFMYLCFGLQNLVVSYWLGREIFHDRRAGWLTAAFVAADGFFIAYSRCSLTDSMLTCFVLWSMLAAVTARTYRGVIATAILVGAATSIKWSGLMTVIPATVALLVLRHVAWYQIFWFVLTPVVHVLIWFAGLHLMGGDATFKGLYDAVLHCINAQQASSTHLNPLASPWYTWPILYHPIVVKLAYSGIHGYYASSAGNVVFWYPISLMIATLPLVTGVVLIRKKWRDAWKSAIGSDFIVAALLLVLGWYALIAMWTIVLGKHMYFYHYMPSYGFGIVLLGGTMAKLERRLPWVVFGFAALAVAVAIYFVPVWCEFPLTEEEAFRRLLFKPWQP